MQGTRPALGWRDVIKVHEEEKEVEEIVEGKEAVDEKKREYFELSAYKYPNFMTVKQVVDEIARVLVDFGRWKGDVFNIYAQTSPNWQLTAQACSSISNTIATAYDTLGESGLTHSLNRPSCVGLFTNTELLSTLFNVLPHIPSVKRYGACDVCNFTAGGTWVVTLYRAL